MMRFAEIGNALAMTSEKFQHYSDNIDFWLTGGFDGVETTPFPGLLEQLFLFVIVWLGYEAIKLAGHNYVYAYNLFAIGYIVYPIARQVELLERFDQTFLFFRAVVLACILLIIFKEKRIKFAPAIEILVFLIFLTFGKSMLTYPFTQNEQRFLYVWDKDRQTPDSMLKMWNDTRIDNSKKDAERNRKIKGE